MSAGKRSIWALAMAAFLTMTSGCATTNLRLVEDEMARPGTGLHEESGQQINGYVLGNGTIEAYKGYARLACSDSLEFWRKDQEYDHDDDMLRSYRVIPGPVFPVAEVDSLDVVAYEMTPGAIVLGVAAVGVVALIVVGMSMNPIKFGPMFGDQ